MMISKAFFKARLIAYPEITDEKTKTVERIGKFTINRKYKVYDIFDNGQGFTDFLVADDEGIFRWINMSVFRAK